MSPIHIQAHRIGIKFKNGVVGESRINNLLNIHLTRFSPKQEPATYMTKHGNLGVFQGLYNSCRHRLLVLC